MIGIDPWLNTLKAVLPGVSAAHLEVVFWNVARDFYMRSRSWRESLGAFTLRPGFGEIELSPVDQGSEPCYLEDVWMPGYPIYMRIETSLAFFHEGQVAGPPARFVLASPTTLAFSPLPDRIYEKALWVLLSVQPKPDSEVLPEYARTHHFKALQEGVLAEMKAMAHKPWTDQAMAVQHARKFEVEISRARADAERQWTKTAGQWSYHTVAIR